MASTKQKKILDAPINIADRAAKLETDIGSMKSIWVIQRDSGLKVDAKKLEKAHQKLQQKQEKRDGAARTTQAAPIQLQQASASQVISKKDNKIENKGTSRSMDIRIENFDVSFGEKVLLQNADLTLAAGRR